MTRSERELLIERYLNGEMSSVQEQDFFIQVAVDKELRQELKAYRTVESAFRKDREAERSEHTALRARVATMLTVTPGGGEPAPVPGGSTIQTPQVGDAGSGVASGLGRSAMRWIAGGGAALLLAVGSYLAVIQMQHGDAQSPAPATAPSATAPTMTTPAAPSATPAAGQASARPSEGVAPSTAPDLRATEGTTASAEVNAERRERTRSIGGASGSAREETIGNRASRSASERSIDGRSTATDAPAVQDAPSATAPKSDRKPNDTINVGVRVQFPKH